MTLWGKRNPDFPRPGDDDRFLLAEVMEWLERRQVRVGRRNDRQADESYADRIRSTPGSVSVTDLPTAIGTDVHGELYVLSDLPGFLSRVRIERVQPAPGGGVANR